MGLSQKLARVQKLIDVGMPCSALAVAKSLHVQFNRKTLSRWRKGDGYYLGNARGMGLARRRAVYAIVVLEGLCEPCRSVSETGSDTEVDVTQSMESSLCTSPAASG